MNNIRTENKPFNFKWFVLLFLMVCFNAVFAAKIKNLNDKWPMAMSVKYNKISKSYTIESRTVGKIQYLIKDKPLLLRKITSDYVKINLLTYPEFIDEIKPQITDLKYINTLKVIEKYLNYLELKPFDLEFNLIILPENYGLLLSTKIKTVNQSPIQLTFVATLPAGEYGSQLLELALNRILPHELFHFLVKYEKFNRMNLLRNETFAHLFGQCVAYEVKPLINDDIILTFPDYFFKSPDVDFKRIKNDMKKDAFVKDSLFPKSILGRTLARYYFQAAANNYSGENINSKNIPKFCHKLFSEHNFKHPIEKKTPPWFKEFLESNRQDQLQK